MRVRPLLLVLAACAASDARAPAPPADGVTAPPGFWDHWGDGQAELDGYRLQTPRYGELRTGTVVHIWVTETHEPASHVKTDGPGEPVLKLNEIRDFRTGIYDYHVMTTVFTGLDGRWPLGQPARVNLSVTEWCGQVYEQWLATSAGFHRTRHSYFEGEADRDDAVPLTGGGLLADQGPLLARGLVGALPDGERPWLTGLLDARLAHREPAWTTAAIRRAPPAPVTVPAGTFDAQAVTVTPADGIGTTWWVEVAPPHRIVRWERTDGEVAELTGSVRGPYWAQHAEGDARLRAALGLDER